MQAVYSNNGISCKSKGKKTVKRTFAKTNSYKNKFKLVYKTQITSILFVKKYFTVIAVFISIAKILRFPRKSLVTTFSSFLYWVWTFYFQDNCSTFVICWLNLLYHWAYYTRIFRIMYYTIVGIPIIIING